MTRPWSHAYLAAVKWSRRKKLMLVTGASGFLGRHLAGTDAVAATGRSSRRRSNFLDVRNREQVLEEIKEWKPNAVVHLAYRKRRPTRDRRRQRERGHAPRRR